VTYDKQSIGRRTTDESQLNRSRNADIRRCLQLRIDFDSSAAAHTLGDEYYHLVALVRSTHIPQFYPLVTPIGRQRLERIRYEFNNDDDDDDDDNNRTSTAS